MKQPNQTIHLAGSTETTLSEQAALEDFVRLQQMQNEYIQWLESIEKQSDLDAYIYKKIR